MPAQTRSPRPSPDPEEGQEQSVAADLERNPEEEKGCDPEEEIEEEDLHEIEDILPVEISVESTEEDLATESGEATAPSLQSDHDEELHIEEDSSNKGSPPSTPPSAERNRLVVPKIKVMFNKNHLPTDIREDEYYYEWVEEILEAFPNKGPPCTPGRLSNHIYIGSLVNSEDEIFLKRVGITHVLNCAGTRRFDLDKSPYAKEVGVKEYMMIPAEDFEDYDIVKHFSTAFAFIDRCKEKGGKCLVHCNLGVNRSGAICAGYLMMSENKSLLQVIEQLKRVRQMVLTNRGFRYQLINYARMRNLLDPIIIENGLPATIAPPTGNSKFAMGARKEVKSKTKARNSDIPPASDFLNINGVASSTCHYGLPLAAPPPRPKSACSMVDPPVSSMSFTRSSSAMGVHRRPTTSKRWSSWSDVDLEDYMEDNTESPYKYETKTSFIKPKRTSSAPTYTRPSTSLGFSNGLSYNDSSTDSSRSFNLFRHKPVYSRTTAVPTIKYTNADSLVDKPRNILNLLNKSRGLGGASNGLRYDNDISEPYHTLTLPSSVQGISYHVPKPPFGTSRRRFGPTKGFAPTY